MEENRVLLHRLPWIKVKELPLANISIAGKEVSFKISGLPRHDLVWYNNYTASRKEFVKRLAYLKPTADLRKKFQYNNLMFLTAGYLVEVITGQKWEEAVRTCVLDPLEMKRTNFSVLDSQSQTAF